MKLRALLTWTLLGVALPGLAAPIYRAGESASSSWKTLLHGEVSLDYSFSSLKLQDHLGDYSSSRLQGMGGRILWSPLSWASVGVEGTWFGETDLKAAAVNSYQASRIGAVAKWTLTPDTNPRLYLLAGVGRSKHKLEFRRWIGNAWPTVEKSISYWMLGIGIETTLWQHFFAGTEATMLRYQSTELWRYHKLANRMETAVRLRVGVRF